MKYTGFKDANGHKIRVGDLLYNVDQGEFRVVYRMDLGGMVMCPPSELEKGNPWPTVIQDLTQVQDAPYYVVGREDDTPAEVSRRIIAIIVRQPR